MHFSEWFDTKRNSVSYQINYKSTITIKNVQWIDLSALYHKQKNSPIYIGIFTPIRRKICERLSSLGIIGSNYAIHRSSTKPFAHHQNIVPKDLRGSLNSVPHCAEGCQPLRHDRSKVFQLSGLKFIGKMYRRQTESVPRLQLSEQLPLLCFHDHINMCCQTFSMF